MNLEELRTFLAVVEAGSLIAASRRLNVTQSTVTARITFLSRETEYTAPVTYSRDQRDKLVVMVEARPDDPKRASLRVGQPLEVRLGAPPAP